MSVLAQYQWPGNVRELGNVIERAVALSHEGKVQVSDLPDNLANAAPDSRAPITELPESGTDLENLVEELEIGMIREALERTGHSRKRSAALLGLTTRSFRYRLQKYGLDGNSEDD